jgi:dienelactone hydrolase
MFAACFLLVALLSSPPHSAQEPDGGAPLARLDPATPVGFPYERYTTPDRFGRTITFYLSRPPADAGDTALPLVVCVQGSGSQSVFLELETPEGTRIASGGSEAALLRLGRERVRVLVVEKPGVAFLDQPAHPGGAEESSAEFRVEHTHERWTAAVHAALGAALELPGIDTGRVLVSGHSEGGQIACAVAALEPRVTHIASLAGGGPTQLFDLLELARAGQLVGPPWTPDEAVAWVERGWREVLADPESTERLFLGHPHRRWTSFCRASALDELRRTSGRVFLAQGTADRNSLPQASDVLYADLLARGRDVTYFRKEGADHGFFAPGDESADSGWLDVHRRLLEWFMETPQASAPVRTEDPG